MDDPNLRAILVLTGRLSNADGKAVDPLKPTEWDKLAHFLCKDQAQVVEPSRLLEPGHEPVLAAIEAAIPRLTQQRLELLLRRVHQVDRKMAEWRERKIWVVRRKGAGYPVALTRKLGATAPPILFVGGNPDLLAEAGIAIVGSRDATYAELHRTSQLGAMVTDAGLTVISGGARGVDDRAVEGALTAGGRAVIVLPDSLAVSLRKRQFEAFIENGQLAMISSVSPDAGYQNGNAMGRNRLIYCLAQGAFVIHSAKHAGGTFSGAKQALEKAWTPVWVDRHNEPSPGNVVLHETHGAEWLPDDPREMLRELLGGLTGQRAADGRPPALASATSE